MEGVSEMAKSAFDVLVAVETVEFLKKDMHYRTNDEFSYAIHLLADKIDFGDDEDDLKECYFLGFKGMLPPTEDEIHAATLDATAKFGKKESNKDLLQAVIDSAAAGIAIVEDAKNEDGIPGGVHAIYDSVSQTMLRAKALAWMSLRNPAKEPEGKKATVQELVDFLSGKPHDAEDGMFGWFDRKKAAEKGWETRKKNGWNPKYGLNVEHKPVYVNAKAQSPSIMNVLPANLTRPKGLHSEIEANREMAK